MIYQTRQLRNGFALMVEEVGVPGGYLVSPVDTSLTLPGEYTEFVVGKAAAISRAELLLSDYERVHLWGSQPRCWEYIRMLYDVEPAIWRSSAYVDQDGDEIIWMVCKDPLAQPLKLGVSAYMILISVNGVRYLFDRDLHSLRKAINQAIMLYSIDRSLNGKEGDQDFDDAPPPEWL